MIIEQAVTIPANYRILLELPRSIPIGVKARVEIHVLDNPLPPLDEIDDVRQLLQKEMAEKGTLMTAAAVGDGWEAHVREHYAKP